MEPWEQRQREWQARLFRVSQVNRFVLCVWVLCVLLGFTATLFGGVQGFLNSSAQGSHPLSTSSSHHSKVVSTNFHSA